MLNTQTTRAPRVIYKWDEGTCVSNYADAASKWKHYTESEAFQAKFSELVDDVSITNDIRAARVEAFLLDEALAAGVVKKVEMKEPKNPNKWGKTLAPWFTDECREAKRNLAKVRR